jgi:hypothetical protein
MYRRAHFRGDHFLTCRYLVEGAVEFGLHLQHSIFADLILADIDLRKHSRLRQWCGNDALLVLKIWFRSMIDGRLIKREIVVLREYLGKPML